MKRTWTIIGVADVPQSFKWYRSLLGLPETAPAYDAYDDFGQIVGSDGTVCSVSTSGVPTSRLR
jgi:catechol 2,3-dioxygenase-like lactoylglutathione lyase family enzyme